MGRVEHGENAQQVCRSVHWHAAGRDQVVGVVVALYVQAVVQFRRCLHGRKIAGEAHGVRAAEQHGHGSEPVRIKFQTPVGHLEDGFVLPANQD